MERQDGERVEDQRCTRVDRRRQRVYKTMERRALVSTTVVPVVGKTIIACPRYAWYGMHGMHSILSTEKKNIYIYIAAVSCLFYGTEPANDEKLQYYKSGQISRLLTGRESIYRAPIRASDLEYGS